MQDIGFVHYWFRHDYRAAADWFERAGDMPGAPWWLQSLAATTLAQGGDRQSSRVMWTAIRQSAEIDWLRNDARPPPRGSSTRSTTSTRCSAPSTTTRDAHRRDAGLAGADPRASAPRRIRSIRPARRSS